MPDPLFINSISQGHQFTGLPAPEHPLVTVIKVRDFQNRSDFKEGKIVLNLYLMHFKQLGSGKFQYGKNSYDYEDGTLLFIAPGQAFEYNSSVYEDTGKSEGWMLAFHPDLIRKSSLAEKIDSYTFFRYSVNEALHLSEKERDTIEQIRDKIVAEYSQNMDRHSQSLMISNIELLFDYCVRFYDRQFYTRANLNSDVVSKFEQLLKTYFHSNDVSIIGIPSVKYFAEKLQYSPNYLGDLLKRETGKSTLDHIHAHIIEKAKEMLLNPELNVTQVAYSLGFEYPQHFSKLFKNKTGLSPSEWKH